MYVCIEKMCIGFGTIHGFRHPMGDLGMYLQPIRGEATAYDYLYNEICANLKSK